jgi:hypothetical protein
VCGVLVGLSTGADSSNLVLNWIFRCILRQDLRFSLQGE